MSNRIKSSKYYILCCSRLLFHDHVEAPDPSFRLGRRVISNADMITSVSGLGSLTCLYNTDSIWSQIHSNHHFYLLVCLITLFI